VATMVSILTRSADRVQLSFATPVVHLSTVSILTRSADRVQLRQPLLRGALAGVSILTRSADRVQPSAPRGPRPTPTGFNPHPICRPGATAPWQRGRTGLRSFNPHPICRPGATAVLCALRSRPAWFAPFARPYEASQPQTRRPLRVLSHGSVPTALFAEPTEYVFLREPHECSAVAWDPRS
jgi:hypothetical protein